VVARTTDRWCRCTFFSTAHFFGVRHTDVPPGISRQILSALESLLSLAKNRRWTVNSDILHGRLLCGMVGRRIGSIPIDSDAIYHTPIFLSMNIESYLFLLGECMR
jgi:hypothetical protein